MNLKIVLYTSQNCENCRIAKLILEQYKLDYTEKIIDNDKDVLLEFEKITNGQKYVPTIVVNDNLYVNIKPHELFELIKIYKPEAK